MYEEDVDVDEVRAAAHKYFQEHPEATCRTLARDIGFSEAWISMWLRSRANSQNVAQRVKRWLEGQEDALSDFQSVSSDLLRHPAEAVKIADAGVDEVQELTRTEVDRNIAAYEALKSSLNLEVGEYAWFQDGKLCGRSKNVEELDPLKTKHGYLHFEDVEKPEPVELRMVTCKQILNPNLFGSKNGELAERC